MCATSRGGSAPCCCVLAIGITLCVVAWGYLVYAAIDFGSTHATTTTTAAWGYLAVAAVGAVACLFLGFMLVARFSRALGITRPEFDSEEGPRSAQGWQARGSVSRLPSTGRRGRRDGPQLVRRPLGVRADGEIVAAWQPRTGARSPSPRGKVASFRVVSCTR